MRILIVSVLAASGLALTSCGGNPCASVPPPSKAAVDLVKAGYEVEKEVGGYDCELTVTGQWQRETE